MGQFGYMYVPPEGPADPDPWDGTDPQGDDPVTGTPAVTPVATSAGGGGNNNNNGGGMPPAGRPVFNIAGAPKFNGPQFTAPTLEQAQNSPGYQFRLQSGQQALERSAAARGVLRTGGTLTDLIQYGQNFGQQEYGNTFNQALSAYDRQYQGAKDAYAPSLSEWQTRAQAEMAAALAQYQREWDIYTYRPGGGGNGGGWPGFTGMEDPGGLNRPTQDKTGTFNDLPKYKNLY